MNGEKFYNPIVIWLLRSPLHRFVDKHTLLLTVTGRKSGKRYTFPVSYIRDGETLLVMTHKERIWWKNLRMGAPVTIFVDGHMLPARGETFIGADMGAKVLLQFLQQVPAWRWDLHLKLDATGQPEHPEALKRLAQDDLVVCSIQAERMHTREPDNLPQSASTGVAR